jgi:hypothetical protein
MFLNSKFFSLNALEKVENTNNIEADEMNDKIELHEKLFSQESFEEASDKPENQINKI